LLDTTLVARFGDYIVNGDLARLTQEIVARQQSRADGIGHFGAAVLASMLRGQRAPLRALDLHIPADSALKFYTHYAMASIAAWDGDVDDTARRLRETVRIGLAGQGVLSNAPNFQQHFLMAAQQALHIDAAAPLGPCDMPDGSGTANAGGRSLTVLASCNGRYFDAFGGPFIASALRHLPAAAVHVHVANPTEPSRAAMAALAAESARLSFSSDAAPDEACLFACQRFLMAQDLMRQRGSDLLISDIDVTFTGKTAALAAIMAADDAGLFERKQVSPMEICHCPLSYFRHTPNTLWFLSLLRRYIDAKLNSGSLRLWMLDQSALFVLSRRAMRRQPPELWQGRPPFRWRDLSETAGAPLSAFQVNQVVDIGGKQYLRQWDKLRDFSVQQGPDARIDRIGPNRFDVYWMRHTGRWWRLHTGLTLAETLHILETDGHLHPL
jgi:hypothetical protein